MNRSLISLFLVLACAAAALQCKKKAEPVTGNVDFISGEVSLVTAEKTAPARIGDAVVEGMKIRTGEKSFARVAFGENVLKIYESTDLEFTSLSRDPNNDSRKTEMNMERGTILSNVSLKLAKGDSHRVTSDTMIAAVRGTEYLYSVDETLGVVACYRGAMSVLRAGSSEEVILNAGEMLTIEKGRKMKPVKIPAGFRHKDFEYGKEPSRPVSSDITDEPDRKISRAEKRGGSMDVKGAGTGKTGGITPAAGTQRAAVKKTTGAAGGKAAGGAASIPVKKKAAVAKEKTESLKTEQQKSEPQAISKKEQPLQGEKKAAVITNNKKQIQPGALLSKPRVDVPEVKE
jgi:hypothetical protein